MLSFGYLFAYIKYLLRPVSPPHVEERVDELQHAFRYLGKREIDDRSLVLQRMIRLFVTQLSDASTSSIQENLIRLLHFHGPRVSRFSTLRQNPHPQDENMELAVLALRRTGLARKHPNQVSALANAYWTLISLCLYPNENLPSAESTVRFFDLLPLYGQNPTPLRLRDGRGMLRPDCFSDTYTAPFQSALAALLILWNRNHNYIAHNIFIRFATARNWTSTPGENPWEQDDQIFNAAREINIIQFQNTICEDVLKGLLSLADTDPSPKLDILKDVSNSPKGNSDASTEILSFKEAHFLYSINPMMGDDGTIFEELMKRSGLSGDVKTLSLEDLSQMYALGSELAKGSAEDLPCLTSYKKSILRVPADSGSYADEDIALVLMDAREKEAGPPGGSLQCPTYTMMIERRAMRQQREWRSCTFNEFRKLYGLQPLPTFSSWNPNPDICREAERVYSHIDNLGLYVGLQCEAPVVTTEKVNSGFGFGFTKTYALLVDIVTRIRSQPPPRLDISLQKIDSDETWLMWVHDETRIKRPSGVNDAVLPKVLQRNFPRQFSADSAYSFFLFSTPSEFKALKDSMLIRNHRICVDRPMPDWQVHILTDKDVYQEVFEGKDSENFSTLYGNQLRLITDDYGYFLGFDRDLKEMHDKDRQMTMFALIPDKSGTLKRYGNVFRRLTADYIVHRSIQQPDGTYQIDIIADVINNVCTRWVCETLCDYKLADDVNGNPSNGPGGQKTTKEMYQEFANLSIFIFKMFGHADSHGARQAALKSSEYLREHIARHIPRPDWVHTDVTLLSKMSSFLWLIYKACKDIFTAWLRAEEVSSDTAQTFLRRAVQANRLIPLPKDELVKLMEKRIETIVDSKTRVNADHVDDAEIKIEVSRVVANVLGLAAVTAVNIPHVSYYLRKDKKAEREAIMGMLKSKEVAESDDTRRKLSGYIHEALRISLPLGLWRKANRDFKFKDGSQVKGDDLVFADFNHLHNQDAHFLKPEKVNTTRERVMYKDLLGMGMHKCPAFTQKEETSFMDQVIPEVIKAVFSLDSLSAVDEVSDKITTGVDSRPHITNSSMYPKLYVDGKGEVSYYPQSLLVQYKSRTKNNEYANFSGLQVDMSDTRRFIIRTIECFIGVVTTLWMVFKVVGGCDCWALPSQFLTKFKPEAASYAMFLLMLLALGLGPRIRRPIKLPQMSDVQTLLVDCSPPLTVWEDWSAHVMAGGPDGIPLDITFNSSFPVAHQLQLYDADQKDTKMAIYVDDILRALTTDFELDKAIDCGDNAYQCYLQQFSFGTVVVPPGSHSVRISWAGKELVNGTYANLGKNASRRVLVRRDYCAT